MSESAEDLRAELIREAEALLANPTLLWGRRRQLTVAVRSYLAVMPAWELVRLAGLVTRYKEIGATGAPGTSDAGTGPGD
jgi:hypothetical protein